MLQRKKQKDLFLSTDFPDRRVFDAYMRPQVDDSEARFEWGLPDLDSLREYPLIISHVMNVYFQS